MTNNHSPHTKWIKFLCRNCISKCKSDKNQKLTWIGVPIHLVASFNKKNNNLADRKLGAKCWDFSRYKDTFNITYSPGNEAYYKKALQIGVQIAKEKFDSEKTVESDYEICMRHKKEAYAKAYGASDNTVLSITGESLLSKEEIECIRKKINKDVTKDYDINPCSEIIFDGPMKCTLTEEEEMPKVMQTMVIITIDNKVYQFDINEAAKIEQIELCTSTVMEKLAQVQETIRKYNETADTAKVEAPGNVMQALEDRETELRNVLVELGQLRVE